MDKNPELINEIKGNKNTILSAKFSIDNKCVIAGGLENCIYFHKLNQPNYHYKIAGHDDVIYSVDYGVSKNVQFFLSASRDKTVKLWRINSIGKKEHYEFEEPVIYRCNNTVRFVNISPLDSSIFCTGSDDKTIKVWSVRSPNKRLNTFSNHHTNWIRCCKFSKKNPNLIASCSDDSSLKIFDLRLNGMKGSSLSSIVKTITTSRNRHFTYLDWYPLSEYFIAIASTNNMIRIYDLRNMAKIIQIYRLFNDSVNCLEFHPSGNYLLASSSDSTSRLINCAEGRSIYTLKGHFKSIFCCAFNHANQDGSQFLTAGKDKSLKLWNFNLDNLDFNLDKQIDESLIDANNSYLYNLDNFKNDNSINSTNEDNNLFLNQLDVDNAISNSHANRDLRIANKNNQQLKHPVQSLINLNNLELENKTKKANNHHFNNQYSNFKSHCNNNLNYHHNSFSSNLQSNTINHSVTNLTDTGSQLNHLNDNKQIKEEFLISTTELDFIFNQLDLLEESIFKLEKRLLNLETKLERIIENDETENNAK